MKNIPVTCATCGKPLIETKVNNPNVDTCGGSFRYFLASCDCAKIHKTGVAGVADHRMVGKSTIMPADTKVMQEELTLEDQKLLTEALGECFHEEYAADESCICSKCGGFRFNTIDFNDGRTTLRLIKKAVELGNRGITVELNLLDEWEASVISGDMYCDVKYTITAFTPEIAVCKAMRLLLKENSEWRRD